jgi:hypothetical protein
MTVSQNGWTVLWSQNSKYLHHWVIPARSGEVQLLLRRGPAGFMLAHLCLWFAESIEPIAGAGDDFGWNPRQISGSSEWSNHASGTAVDLNASTHPTYSEWFRPEVVAEIHDRLEIYSDLIRWGGDYHSTIDQMHWEINDNPQRTHEGARVFLSSNRGNRLIAANPTQEKFVA